MTNTVSKKISHLMLDLLAIPGLFMSKKYNALYHINVICRFCPEHRKTSRYKEKVEQCWWEDNWKKGNYDIPRNFGFLNYIRCYIGMKPKL